MSSGADLFVVCKQCGSEVSPYITECPYCGHRLRRRAPKLPPANAPTRSTLRGRARSLLTGSKPVSVVEHAEPLLYVHMAVIGPLQGDWWKLLTNGFAYVDGVYAFVAILTVAI